jgi:hypothetical protein
MANRRAIQRRTKSERVLPSITLRIHPERKELALAARGTAALVLAGALGAGLLVWVLTLLVKFVT